MSLLIADRFACNNSINSDLVKTKFLNVSIELPCGKTSNWYNLISMFFDVTQSDLLNLRVWRFHQIVFESYYYQKLFWKCCFNFISFHNEWSRYYDMSKVKNQFSVTFIPNLVVSSRENNLNWCTMERIAIAVFPLKIQL